jgi:hypothetical protein
MQGQPDADLLQTELTLAVKRAVNRLSTLSCQPHGPSNPLPDMDAVVRCLPSILSAPALPPAQPQPPRLPSTLRSPPLPRQPAHPLRCRKRTIRAPEVSPEPPRLPAKRARLAPPVLPRSAAVDEGLHPALLRLCKQQRSAVPPLRRVAATPQSAHHPFWWQHSSTVHAAYNSLGEGHLGDGFLGVGTIDISR